MLTILQNFFGNLGKTMLELIYPRINEMQILIMFSGLILGGLLWLSEASNFNHALAVIGSDFRGLIAAVFLFVIVAAITKKIYSNQRLSKSQKDLAALVAFGVYGYIGFYLFFLTDSTYWGVDTAGRINYLIGYYFATINLLRFSLFLLTMRFTTKLVDYTAQRIQDYQLNRVRLTLGVIGVAILIEVFKLRSHGLLVSMYMAVNYMLLIDMTVQALAPLHKIGLYRVHSPERSRPVVRAKPRAYSRSKKSLLRRKRLQNITKV